MKYIAILAYEKWCVITINLYHGNEAWNAVVCQTWTLADFLASHMISGKVFFEKKVSTQTSTALLYKIEIQSKEILRQTTQRFDDSLVISYKVMPGMLSRTTNQQIS